jgi:S1-C subfamily serine protease
VSSAPKKVTTPAESKAPPSATAASDNVAADPVVAVAPDATARAVPATLQPGPAGTESPYLGVIDRTGLAAIIEQGLGRVLARLHVSPVLVQGKFQGFRVNAIDPAWSAAGLLVNDVVLRLNGQPIERPEQAVVAFESLRVASELALELSRGGQKLSLRYRIEGAAPSPSTSSAMAPR